MQLKLESTQCYINYSHIVYTPLHVPLTVSSFQCVLFLALGILTPQTIDTLYSIHRIESSYRLLENQRYYISPNFNKKI